MSKWFVEDLRGKIQIKHGFPFKSQFFSNQKSDFIVLTPGNFHEKGGFKRQLGKEKYYIGEVPKEYLHSKGDVIVAMTEQAAGLLGSCAKVPESGIYLHNQRLGLITTNTDKILKNYIYHLFKIQMVREQIRLTSSGSKVKHTSPEKIYDVKVPIPSINEQQNIVTLLDSIDNKIELNNKINAELEAMAKLIYDYWFVQFDFPDANGKPYKSSGGKMVYNKELKREIPDGWGAGNVDKECFVRNGFAFKSESYTESGYTIIRTKNFKNGSVEFGDIAYISQTDAKSFKHYELEKFDFLLVMVGASLGKNVIVNSNILPALQNQNMWCVRSKYSVQHFTNQLLKRIIIEQLSTSSGSAREFFTKEFFKKAKFVNPNIELKKLYCEKVESIFNRIDIIKNENQKLTELRDWLLPMLMNGQVTVKDT